MSDETTTDTTPAADDQGNDAPVVPTDTVEPDAADDGGGSPEDSEARITELKAELAAANDRIAELESSPAPEGNDFGGVRTPELERFEENQFLGDVQGWERDTGLSYADTEPEA